jgi:hypothetical protein
MAGSESTGKRRDARFGSISIRLSVENYSLARVSTFSGMANIR